MAGLVAKLVNSRLSKTCLVLPNVRKGGKSCRSIVMATTAA